MAWACQHDQGDAGRLRLGSVADRLRGRRGNRQGAAVVEILAPSVARIAAANLLQVHVIAEAKTETDKIDVRVSAQPYAAGVLPEVQISDAETKPWRCRMTRRNRLANIWVRLKAIVQSILHGHHAPRCPHPDTFGGRGHVGFSLGPCRWMNGLRLSGKSTIMVSKWPRSALIAWVCCPMSRSRNRKNTPKPCCSGVFISTKRMTGPAASATALHELQKLLAGQLFATQELFLGRRAVRLKHLLRQFNAGH